MKTMTDPAMRDRAAASRPVAGPAVAGLMYAAV